MFTDDLIQELRKAKRVNPYRKVHLYWNNQDGSYHVLSSRFKSEIRNFLKSSQIEIGFSIK